MKKITALLFMLAMLPLASANIYSPNETINFLASLTDAYGRPIPNASCVGIVFLPNMTLYKKMNLTYNNGVYYSTFALPNVYGTYLEEAICNYTLYGRERTAIAYKTFYVSRSLNVLEDRLEEIANNATVNVTVNITGRIENVTNATLDKLDEILAVMFAFHSTPVTKSYCIDEHHLQIVKTAEWTVGHWKIPVVKNETEYCQWGCDAKSGTCAPPPWKQALITAGIVIFIVIVVWIIYANIRSRV